MKKLNKYFINIVLLIFFISSISVKNVFAQVSNEAINKDSLTEVNYEAENNTFSLSEELDNERQVENVSEEEFNNTDDPVKENDEEDIEEDINDSVKEEDIDDSVNKETSDDSVNKETSDDSEQSPSDLDEQLEETNPTESYEEDKNSKSEENTDADKDPETEEIKEEIDSLSIKSSILELDNYSEVDVVAYHANITGSNGYIYNMPADLDEAEIYGNIVDFNSQSIIVRREGRFSGRTWVLAEKDGEYLGWFLKNKITPKYESITSNRTVAYSGSIKENNRYQIFNLPAYTEGSYKISDSNQFSGESVIIREEIETNYEYPRVWLLIEIDGKIIGWINKNAITIDYNNILDEKTVAYDAKINSNGRYQIFNRPAYTKGNYQVANISEFIGKHTIIRSEVTTDYYGETTWVLLEVDGQQVGWVNSNAITPAYDTIKTERIIANEGIINTNGRYQIFNRPAYTEGNYKVSDSLNLFGEKVVVRKEIHTRDNRTWFLIEVNGREVGWINKNAITLQYDKVISSRKLSHPRIIRNLNGRYQIYSTPAYTKGNYQVYNILDYAGDIGIIIEERVTNRGVWHLLSVNGRTIGWINDKALRKPRVYIDPGHGGHDSGASFGGVHEKNLSLQTSKYLKNQLNNTGYYNVIMARESDYFLELSDRSSGANNKKADIFISLHYNSMGGIGSAQGIETFIYHKVASGFGQESNRNNFRVEDPRIKNSLKLADAVHNNLIKDTGMYNRGVKGNNFHVVRETNMPAILLELGFLDNTSERNKVIKSSYQRKAASAVVKGVNAYFKN